MCVHIGCRDQSPESRAAGLGIRVSKASDVPLVVKHAKAYSSRVGPDPHLCTLCSPSISTLQV